MTQRLLSLLLILFFAPACAPDSERSDQEYENKPAGTRNLVLLTDTLNWKPGELATYRDSLEIENYRILISGFPGETPTQLTARLPWLLQPGVALFLYDSALSGPAGADSLRRALSRLERDVPVEIIKR